MVEFYRIELRFLNHVCLLLSPTTCIPAHYASFVVLQKHHTFPELLKVIWRKMSSISQLCITPQACLEILNDPGKDKTPPISCCLQPPNLGGICTFG